MCDLSQYLVTKLRTWSIVLVRGWHTRCKTPTFSWLGTWDTGGDYWGEAWPGHDFMSFKQDWEKTIIHMDIRIKTAVKGYPLPIRWAPLGSYADFHVAKQIINSKLHNLKSGWWWQMCCQQQLSSIRPTCGCQSHGWCCPLVFQYLATN